MEPRKEREARHRGELTGLLRFVQETRDGVHARMTFVSQIPARTETAPPAPAEREYIYLSIG